MEKHNGKRKTEKLVPQEPNSSHKILWDALSNIEPKYKTQRIVDGVPLTYVHPHRGREILTELFGPEGTGWKRELLSKDDKGDYISIFMQLHYKISLLRPGSKEEWGSVCEFGSAFKRYDDPITRQTLTDHEADKKAYTNAFSRCLTALGYASEIFLEEKTLPPDSPHGEAEPGTKTDKLPQEGNDNTSPTPPSSFQVRQPDSTHAAICGFFQKPYTAFCAFL